VHIADNNGNVLKPQIVTARIYRNRSPARRQVLDEINMFVPNLHSDDAHARAEHAFQMLVLFAEHFRVGNLVKRERGVNRNRTIHVADRYSHSIDGDWRLLSIGNRAEQYY